MRPSAIHRPARLVAACLSLALAVALTACGSDPAEEGATVPDGGESAGSPDTDTDADTVADSPTSSFDGTTYEATGVFTCLTLGGSVNAELISDDDLVRIGVSLPPLDAAPGEWSGPSVYLRDDTDPDDQLHLESGSEISGSFEGYADVAVVDDYTIDGQTGSGSATFIDPGMAMAGTAEPVTGTFTVGCE
ncbi:hypothetical protein [Nocardioides sp.]|uniref:hypothetical protein n=1 Tax=Nocardioides sp. TaxID=35761 RepID=UPI002B277DED|nr:hypothetical protein [Nocardioides sp.]